MIQWLANPWNRIDGQGNYKNYGGNKYNLRHQPDGADYFSESFIPALACIPNALLISGTIYSSSRLESYYQGWNRYRQLCGRQGLHYFIRCCPILYPRQYRRTSDLVNSTGWA